jgi:NADPH:quinone reductase-like Zn-dependent oxidoreductase
MKAFIVDRYKRKLRFGEMPDPALRDHDVLVQIHAAGVNPLDSKIRDGDLKLILPYRLPLILGNELAGVVVRVGSKVLGFKPGDEVYARPNQDRIGTFAEFIAMNEADVALKAQKPHHGRGGVHSPCGSGGLASLDRPSELEEG